MSATVTDTQNAYNLKTARTTVAAAQGVDPENLSYDERVAYNKALAAFILAHPLAFNDQSLSTAQGVAGKTYDQLADDSFSFGDFGEDVLANAVPVLGDFTNKLLMIAALAAVVYIIVNKKTPSGPAALPA